MTSMQISIKLWLITRRNYQTIKTGLEMTVDRISKTTLMLTNNVKLYVQADTGKHEEGKKREAIKKKLLEMKNIIIKR